MNADASSSTYQPSPVPSSRFDTHLLVVIAILLTSAALAVFVSRTLGLPEDTSLISGCGFAVAALLGHLGVSRATTAVVHQKPRTKSRRVKKASARSPENSAERLEPILPRPSTLAETEHRLSEGEPAPSLTGGDGLIGEPRLNAEPNWQGELGRAIPSEPHFSAIPQRSVGPPPMSPAMSPAQPAAGVAPPGAPKASTIDESEVQRVEKLVRQLAENVRLLEQLPPSPGLPISRLPISGLPTSGLSGLAPTSRGSASPSDIMPPTATTPLSLQIAAVIAEAVPSPPPVPRTTEMVPRTAEMSPFDPPAIDAVALTGVGQTHRGQQHDPFAEPVPTPAGHPSRERDEIIAALNAQRIDVFLEPILDIREQKPHHFEVSIALRTASGTAIDLAQAERQLGGTGLLPLIDQTRIVQAANLAEKLAERGKTGSVLTGVQGETLADEGFKRSFASGQRTIGAFPGHLVLAIPQSAVAHFTAADWQTLARLR
ncbi:MAG: hypothetical protein K2Y05_05705, partial [Hyphomicrobiaceae bacterium]|nr:hypothetical protein [Hyphomicrobiaceae bacterium]